MAGFKRTRARRQAQAMAEGRDPTWVDPRETKKPIDRDADFAAKQARKIPVGLPEPSAPASADADAFAKLLGGVAANELDAAASAEFDNLRALAFQFAREIMELPLRADDKNFAKILGVKQGIAQALLTAAVRVRPSDLQDRDEDGVSELLEEVRRQGQHGHADAEPQSPEQRPQQAVDPEGAEAQARAHLFS